MQSDYGPLNRAIKKASLNLGIDIDTITKVYWAYCKVLQERLASLPFEKDLTEEEFKKLRPNINLPSLGKIYCNWDIYTGEKKRLEYVRKGRENKIAKYRLTRNNEPIQERCVREGSCEAQEG
jgi:hypothetical protein